MPPRVSILLPAWNAAATIGVALESIRRQTVSSWECVVVDDGSEDATPDLVARLAVTDPRVRLLRTAHHGLISALNTGLDDCAAPLIARMDADDVMHRRRLEYQTAALERDRSLSAVGCRVRIFPRRALSARMCEYEIWLNSLSSAGEVLRDAFIECPGVESNLALKGAAAHRKPLRINLGLRKSLQRVYDPADAPSPPDHVTRGSLRIDLHEVAGGVGDTAESRRRHLAGSVRDRGDSTFAELVARETARWSIDADDGWNRSIRRAFGPVDRGGHLEGIGPFAQPDLDCVAFESCVESVRLAGFCPDTVVFQQRLDFRPAGPPLVALYNHSTGTQR